MKSERRYLLVDDDYSNHMICEMVIKNIKKNAEVIAFESPLEGLAYIEKEYTAEAEKVNTILLLDINMPAITGWQFLEKFHHFPKHIKDQFTIYILSSSIDSCDKQKATDNPEVKGYLVKPLSFKLMEEMIS